MKTKSLFRSGVAFFQPAILIFSLTIFAGGACRVQADTLELTLGEVLSRVETENLQILLNREIIEQAIQQAGRERSFLYPQVNVEVSQARSKSPALGQLRGFVSQTTSNRFDAAVRASFSLVDPALIAAYQAASKGVELSREQYDSLVQEVFEISAQVYLAHQRNIKRFEVIEANIDRAEVLLDLARNQLEAGVATEIDVTRAQVTLATERQARLQQETVVYQSELSLKRLLDIDLDRAISIRDFVAHREADSEQPQVREDAVLGDRADYRVLERRLEQNKLEQRAASWERFPTLSVFGDYGIAAERAFDGDEQEVWSAGVALRMPIFEGYRIRSNRMLANSRRRATEIELRDLRQEISSELLLAWRDLRSRLAQIEVAEENLELAEEEFRLARTRFEQGVADNREVVDAQNRVSQADDNLVEAYFQYNLTRLEYARVRGDVRLLLGDQVVP